MTEPIRPALTPEEWREWLDYVAVAGVEFRGDERRKLAAYLLEGQKFGFTREDVKLLRDEAEGEWNGDQMPVGRQLLKLAARIEALLPPEAK